MALFGKKSKSEETPSCCCGGNCDAESMEPPALDSYPVWKAERIFIKMRWLL